MRDFCGGGLIRSSRGVWRLAGMRFCVCRFSVPRGRRFCACLCSCIPCRPLRAVGRGVSAARVCGAGDAFVRLGVM